MARQHSKPNTEVLSALRVTRRMAPDQDGAKRLALRYGDQLVCVRHRVNSSGDLRFTTVELLVEQTPIIPTGARLLAVRLEPGDKSTRSLLMACAATWDKARKLWLAPRKVVRSLGLLHKVVQVPG